MKKIYQILGLAVCAGLMFTACEPVNPADDSLSVGTFEEIQIDSTGYYFATGDSVINCFNSGDFNFYTFTSKSDWGTYYYGFCASNIQDTTFVDYQDAYKSACGGAAQGQQYGVWYLSYSGGDGIKLKKSGIVKGCYLTNSIYSYTSMLNGDSFAKKFDSSDWFLLTITGYNAGVKTGSIEFYLAKDGQIVKDWTYCSLESLGTIDELEFGLTSSDNGDYGMNTPAYFCIDEVGSAKL